MNAHTHSKSASPFITFTRKEWAQLRASTPLTLDESDLRALRGINDHISLVEVEDVFLPISRLLNLYIRATQQLHQTTDLFLGSPAPKVPYVIGIAGSVAVGKSTTARILQALLSRWPDPAQNVHIDSQEEDQKENQNRKAHLKVDLVTTDGFLYPNAVLQQKGIMRRKGFPESYDLRRLVRFISDVKSGCAKVTAPVYSHLSYDIVPEVVQTVEHPDVLILEGLNVLQRGDTPGEMQRSFVSDFFDFSIYVDAEETDIRQWFQARFQRLRETAFQDPTSYFHHYATLSLDEALQIATNIWEEINGVNLRENILPTRERASLILEKGPNHKVQRVRLRKL